MTLGNWYTVCDSVCLEGSELAGMVIKYKLGQDVATESSKQTQDTHAPFATLRHTDRLQDLRRRQKLLNSGVRHWVVR
jgi:hypothetical protein